MWTRRKLGDRNLRGRTLFGGKEAVVGEATSAIFDQSELGDFPEDKEKTRCRFLYAMIWITCTSQSLFRLHHFLCQPEFQAPHLLLWRHIPHKPQREIPNLIGNFNSHRLGSSLCHQQSASARFKTQSKEGNPPTNL